MAPELTRLGLIENLERASIKTPVTEKQNRWQVPNPRVQTGRQYWRVADRDTGLTESPLPAVRVCSHEAAFKDIRTRGPGFIHSDEV